MNEDYLWDKTGSDPEIEKLENALQAFRSAAAAPVLPAKIIPLTVRKPRRFFRSGFAAACVMLALIGAGFWILTADKHLKGGIDSAKAVTAPNSAPALQEDSEASHKNPVVTKTNVSPVTQVKFIPPAKQKYFKARQIVPAAFHSKTVPIIKNSVPSESVAQLTGEEKYAYDQLMLALSITSSKLRIVKDKVDGAEKPNPVLK